MNIDEMVRGTQDAMSVRRVYGEPIERDGLTLIPAAKVTGGGGAGGDPTSGSGGGFGVRAVPIGMYVIREGKVTFQPAIDVNRMILGAQVVALFFLLVVRAMVRRRK